MEDDKELIKQTTKKLLKKLGFSNIGVEVKTGNEDPIEVQIDASPEDSGILIGFHGETLSALQLIVGQLVYKNLGEWRRIVLNIGDYREKRQRSLETMAINASQRAKQTNQPVVLPYLTSSERRLIHLSLANDPDVKTYSEGEGRRRRLIIIPKEEEDEKKRKKMDEKDK